MGFYLFLYYLAQSVSQLFLKFEYNPELVAFCIISALACFSIIPVCLTRFATPEPEKAVVVAEEAPAVPVVPAAKPVSKPAPEPKVEVAKTAPAVVTKKNEPKQLQNKPGAHMIQVGAYRTAAKATTGWNRLVKANKALLGGLSPFVVRADLGSRGVFHRLRAGPVDGPEAAAALCSRLKQRKVGCLVIKP